MASAGESLSHFRLVEKIGEGALGSVWKAVDTRSEREVALKLLRPSRDPERLERIQAAARDVAAISHPGIVTIDSVEQSGDTQFLCMELIRGTTLDRKIPDGGLDVADLVALALPLTDAVRAAHEHGMVHRNLKPGKVLVDETGQVHIIDFGLADVRARQAGPEDDTDTEDTPTLTLTQDGTGRGTVPYMSPEQIQGKRVDRRTDVFSLGIMLYQMATGRLPFDGQSPADVFVAIIRDDPPQLAELNPALPEPFQRIVGVAINKEPDRRFQSVHDLHRQLAQLDS